MRGDARNAKLRWISGCDGLIAHDDYTDSSPRYAAQFLLKIDNCYTPHIYASTFWHAKTGVSFNCTLTQVQAFMFADNEINGAQTCLYIRHNMECPDGQIRNNFFQFRNIGLDIGNVAKWRVTGGTSRIEGSVLVPYDMQFLEADNIIVTGHTFESHEVSEEAPSSRVNIYINADYPVIGGHGRNFLIDTNIFGDLLDQPFAASAIQTTLSAQNIQIGSSNAFIGPFGPTIVDNPSGTAVTLAGFPTANTIAPATVVPNTANGNAAPPNLGSNTVPWPASFSAANYMPKPGSAPNIPPLWIGWVIYTDPSVNGKLFAYNGTTTVTLASPS